MFVNATSGDLFIRDYDTAVIAGADEAGAGALAGPVSAAAVILTTDYDWSFLRDSKVISRDKRCEYSSEIKEHALSYAVVFVSHTVVDRINILNARLLAMQTALMMLKPTPHLALIDGNKTPKGLPFDVKAVIKGDRIVKPISAASILAKVERDGLMTRFSLEFMDYGFEKHFGYPTSFHKGQLENIGYCKIHRKSYTPVKDSFHRFDKIIPPANVKLVGPS